jgi:hypothetical protein
MTWVDIRDAEQVAIAASRERKSERFTGLAFSGGGIRRSMRRTRSPGRSIGRASAASTSAPARSSIPKTAAQFVYIKASLAGGAGERLPADILHYAALHPEFPHESTADQWFDEQQFGGYRKLGYRCAESAMKDVGGRSIRCRDARSASTARHERRRP